MYKQLQFKFMLLLALLATGASFAWAGTSTLSFSAKCGGSGTADDGVKWTVTSDGAESNFEQDKGIHYGTSSAQVTYIKLSTSGISGTISKVVVNASTASGVTATVGVTVGGSAFGGEAKSLSQNATDYTFEGSASGEIVVTVTKPSKAKKALYVKSIVVTYGDGSTSTLAKPTFDPEEGEVAYNTTINILSDAYTVVYTTNGQTPSWNDNVGTVYSDKQKPVVTSDVTIKAIAVAIDGDNVTESDVATATYTVKRPAAPTFSPAAGAVEAGTTVTISGRPDKGYIIYTTDGTDPDYDANNGTHFTDGDVITINSAMTIKAIAVDSHGFSSAIVTAKYTLTVVDPNANDGSFEKPYTVAEVIEGTATGSGIYVKGYIVGEYVGKDTAPRTSGFSGNTNFALADEFTTSPTAGGSIPVQLDKNSGLQEPWGLKSNAGRVTYEVILKGNAETYFSVNGIKGTSEVTATGIYATIATSGKSSYCAADALELVDGVKAYAVTRVTSTSATMKELTGSIPANTGVMLVGTGGEGYTLPIASEGTADASDNLLVGTANGTTVAEAEGTTYLALSQGEFVKMNPGTIKAHKAYLPVESSILGENSKLALSFEDGNATAINEVNTDDRKDDAFYNLNGMRVFAPQKGIYILNGKKVIVK